MNDPFRSVIRLHALPADGGHLPLTVAESDRSDVAVVIMPSAFGVAPDLQRQMRELADEGARVVTFDPFFRDDPGPAPYEDMPRIMKRLQALDRERTSRDLGAVIDWARKGTSTGRVIVVGICFGGPFALLAAADGAADAVVTWHGTRMENHLQRADEMRCPLALHFGSADPVVPPAAVEAIRQAFAGRDDVRIFVHEGATHGFTHPGAARAHHPEAERAAMDSVREMIRLARLV